MGLRRGGRGRPSGLYSGEYGNNCEAVANAGAGGGERTGPAGSGVDIRADAAAMSEPLGRRGEGVWIEGASRGGGGEGGEGRGEGGGAGGGGGGGKTGSGREDGEEEGRGTAVEGTQGTGWEGEEGRAEGEETGAGGEPATGQGEEETEARGCRTMVQAGGDPKGDGREEAEADGNAEGCLARDLGAAVALALDVALRRREGSISRE